MSDDTLIAYALGLLDDHEAREVECHLESHPQDAARVREHLESLTAVVLSEAPEPLPDGAEAALLERIREQPSVDEDHEKVSAPPPITTLLRRPRARPWLALAATLALLAVGFGALRPLATDLWVGWRVNRYQARAGAVTEVLTDAGGERLGQLVRLTDNRLLVAMDEPPPRRQVYQAWEIAGDTLSSRGTWQGRLFAVDPLAANSTFGVTLEPPGGSAQPTSTPLLLFPL